MPGVGFFSQYCITTALYTPVLALNSGTIHKALSKLAFVSLTGTQYDVLYLLLPNSNNVA